MWCGAGCGGRAVGFEVDGTCEVDADCGAKGRCVDGHCFDADCPDIACADEAVCAGGVCTPIDCVGVTGCRATGLAAAAGDLRSGGFRIRAALAPVGAYAGTQVESGGFTVRGVVVGERK